MTTSSVAAASSTSTSSAAAAAAVDSAAVSALRALGRPVSVIGYALDNERTMRAAYRAHNERDEAEMRRCMDYIGGGLNHVIGSSCDASVTYARRVAAGRLNHLTYAVEVLATEPGYLQWNAIRRLLPLVEQQMNEILPWL